jgi:hypothetical protein
MNLDVLKASSPLKFGSEKKLGLKNFVLLQMQCERLRSHWFLDKAVCVMAFENFVGLFLVNFKGA